jgi:glucose-1-phosphate adenylyltransferase
VRRSVLFCKARVDEGSVVEDSLVLPDTRVGRGVTLRRTIVDKRCRLPDGFSAGVDQAADEARGFHVTPSGITLVTQEMLETDTRPGGS